MLLTIAGITAIAMRAPSESRALGRPHCRSAHHQSHGASGTFAEGMGPEGAV